MVLVRFMLFAFTVVLFSAVSCPNPSDPVPVIKPELSEARKKFASFKQIGLYKNGFPVVLYNEVNYQYAYNEIDDYFRVQSDDQTSFFHIQVTSGSFTSSSVSCQIFYSASMEEETLLIIKFINITPDNTSGMIWWWNELQEIGMILPDESSLK